MNIVRAAPYIVAGSAISAFGFSFGRDVYKKSKKLPELLLIAIVFIGLLGSYVAGLWIARNEKTIFLAIMNKFGAVIIYLLSLPALYLVGLFLTNMLFEVEVGPNAADSERHFNAPFDVNKPLLSAFFIISSHFLFLFGLARGALQRKARRYAWNAERENAVFFESHGITVLDDENIVDVDGTRYTLKNVFSDRLEWLAVGKRNKRGYITFDDYGRYTSWSGLVSL